MPPLRTAGFPANHPSFSKHRFSLDTPRFALNLNLTKPLPSPTWASLPTPPMSGTPPPEAPSEVSQLAGRRRKREDTPPASTGPATGWNISSTSPLVEQTAHWRGEPQRTIRASEPHIITTSIAVPWEPHPAYSTVGGVSVSSYAGGPLSIGQTQVSPRSTRKTKAHVASACVNCKKKHLRCDETRPCRRCVQSGKEDSCKDVEHKKRGRPPLKPDEPSSGRTSRSGPTWSAPSFTTSGGIAGPAGSAFPSGYPPLLPQPTPRPILNLPSPYAQPSLAQSSITATGQFASPQRQPAYLAGIQGPPSIPYTDAPQPQSQYGYIIPAQAPGAMMPPQSYPGALFPRPQQTPPAVPEGPTGFYGTSSLQLPPILPAPPSSSSDPTAAQQQIIPRQQPSLQPSRIHSASQQEQQQEQEQQRRRPEQRQQQQQGSSDSDGERDPKRPRMDIQGILGPRHD